MTRLAIISEALRQSFCGPRQVAEVGHCSLASAKRYFNGSRVPPTTVLAQLMRHSSRTAQAFWEYLGVDQASLDAEGAELRRLLITAYGEIEALHAECQRLLAEVEKPVASLAAAPDPGTDQPAARGIQAEGRR